ncbi:MULTISPECIES: Gfo/Idh/MocA family oxidoreductase [unclassified Pseudoxanthomonas]|uniref:Gfo/Idh/MocA family protein n=1 Tax=unclassified Pseudoxanthomonas TaxID=2645906 RepID=UPI003077C463
MDRSHVARRSPIKTIAGVGLAGVTTPLWSKQTTRKRLGVALVGLGYYSREQLAPALQLTRHCHLAGIVTGSPDKAVEWQKRYRVVDKNIYDYDSFKNIVDNDDIDVVYIATPNHLHKPLTLAAAAAGKHVWCEKPMAMNAAEAQSMIDACQQHRVQLAIGYRMQHEPNTRRIIGFAREKPYGSIKSIRAEAGFKGFNEGWSDAWRLDPARGGGAMYDMGVYALNAARYISGEEPVAVTATQAVHRPDIFRGVDEAMRFRLEFPSGITAECSTSLGADMNLLHTDCERGWYELSPFQSYDGIQGRTSSGEILDVHVPNQQARQMDDDALSILNGTAPLVPGEEGLRDMRVIDAIFASMRSGKRVQVSAV